jgi:hypothetical protein
MAVCGAGDTEWLFKREIMNLNSQLFIQFTVMWINNLKFVEHMESNF